MEKLLRRLKSLQEKSGNQLTCEELAQRVGKNVAVVDNSPDYYEILGEIDHKRTLVVVTKEHIVSSYPRNGGPSKIGEVCYKKGDLIVASFSRDAYFPSTLAIFERR